MGTVEHLEWRGLGAAYGKQSVFSDWSGRADGGKLTCLVGRNGAGKSTLLKVLGGILKPERGMVLANGEDLGRLTGPERARRVAIGLTSGLPGGFSTVEDLIAMGRHPYTGWDGRLRTCDREAIEGAITCAGVGELRDRVVGTLSDGERQRALIARAIAQETPVLLLDEPTAFLDLAHRVELLERLRRLAVDTGRVIFFSIHDLDLGIRFADRMLLVGRDGGLEAGAPDDLVTRGRIGAAFDTATVAFSAERGRFELKGAEAACINP